MGKTSIEWTDYTFNPWIGCQRVSPGCEHCYAEALVKRAPALVLGHGYHIGTPGRLPIWGPLAPRRITSDAYWEQPKRWNRLAEKAGGRKRVFCASMADVFEAKLVGGERLDEFRTRLWDLIEQTPFLDWMLLTKRPRNILHMVPAKWISDPPSEVLRTDRWPTNVWVGCTVEDQHRADDRLPHLLQVPAPVRFVSYEPALEAVDFAPWLSVHNPSCFWCYGRGEMPGTGERCPSISGIDWLIVGGESGPGARPFDLAWARSAVAQCRDAGVPVFVKQMGSRPYDGVETCSVKYGPNQIDVEDRPRWLKLADPKGGDMEEWPEDLRIREFPR